MTESDNHSGDGEVAEACEAYVMSDEERAAIEILDAIPDEEEFSCSSPEGSSVMERWEAEARRRAISDDQFAMIMIYLRSERRKRTTALYVDDFLPEVRDGFEAWGRTLDKSQTALLELLRKKQEEKNKK